MLGLRAATRPRSPWKDVARSALTNEIASLVNVDSKMTGARRFCDSSTVDGKTLLDVQKEVPRRPASSAPT
jgi:hypothetical protein